MAPILGQHIAYALVGVVFHVDDVARVHVDALRPRVLGGEDYILASEEGDDGDEGADADADDRNSAGTWDGVCSGTVRGILWLSDSQATWSGRAVSWWETGEEEVVC